MRAGLQLASLALLAVITPPAHARSALEGDVTIHVPEKLGDAFTPGGDLLVHWQVDRLLGEPLVVCRAAWVVDASSLDRWIGDSRCRVPGVRDQIQLLHGTVELGLTRDGRRPLTLDGRRVVLRCDLGAPARHFSGRTREFEKRPTAARKKHYSYNLFGSPHWAELFLPQVTDAQAKALVADRFSMLPGVGATSERFSHLVDGAFSHAAVAACVAQKDREAREQELERLRARQLKLRRLPEGGRKRQLPAQASAFWDAPRGTDGARSAPAGGGFFDEPNDPFTLEEAQRQSEVGARLAAARDAAEKAGVAVLEEQRLVEARRAEVAARLVPGRCQALAQAIEPCALSRCGAKPPWRAPDPSALVFNCDGPCMQRRREAWNGQWGEIRRDDQDALARWEACLAPARVACAPPGWQGVADCADAVLRVQQASACANDPGCD